MEITEKTIDNISVYSIKGQIRISTQNECKKYFGDIVDKKSHLTVILNMSGVGYINNPGVSMIVKCFKKFKENGGRLIICSLVPEVAKLFKIVKLTEILEIYSDEESAIKSITT